MKTLLGLSAIIGLLLVSGSTFASPITGAKNVSDTLGSRMEIKYDVVLQKVETTFFLITGDGKSDIDCAVYDEQGHMVAKDADESSVCTMQVSPVWAGHFTLLIQNAGPNPSRFIGNVF